MPDGIGIEGLHRRNAIVSMENGGTS